MPKTKKVEEDSSDSDSGPEDKNPPPPPAKKAKKDEAPNESQADESGTRWTLEKLRLVNISDFRGRKSVDIREFYEKNGKILPGKKGISLSALQWRKLLEIADEVTAALENQ